jgi:DtxR family Mn-dependent transcriptional regulator
LAERFLTDILGLSWATAHREAGKWEHVMSDEVETAMVRILGNPMTCPHGNPIPGTGFVAEAAKPLAGIIEGSDFTVARIPETLEFAPGILDFLESSELLPGRRGTVDTTNTDGSVVVLIQGRSVTVDPYASARLLVVAAN